MIPSRDLPSELPTATAELRSVLSSIKQDCLPIATVDLRTPIEVGDADVGDLETHEQVGPRDVEIQHCPDALIDEFEAKHLRHWLERVLRASVRSAVGASEEWNVVIDEASTILARLEDDSEDTIYILPAHNAAPRSPLPVRVHNHTLVAATTGHRTWGSAPILSRRIAREPDRFFPTAPSSRLRVLELGSGTGLVGISTLSVLRAFGVEDGEVTLSDGGETNGDDAASNGVIDNLRRNLQVFLDDCGAEGGSRPRAEVRSLRWDEFPGGGGGSRGSDEGRYDVLLGADLIYEIEQVDSLWGAVAHLLEFPGLPTHRSRPIPAFHLVVPLRPTHTREIALLDEYFPRSWSQQTRTFSSGPNGHSLGLITSEREEFFAPDGFHRRGRGESTLRTIRYRRYKIEWQVEGGSL
ncbi:hypothetical protein JCM16303_005180 [Sporobolomyces ruberrimus]